MTMTVVLELLLITLASRAILDAWLAGSIFAAPRAWLEAWRDWEPPAEDDAGGGPDAAGAILGQLARFLGELLTCRFCLGYHVCFWTSVLVAGWSWPLPAVWLAATALVGLLDLTFGVP